MKKFTNHIWSVSVLCCTKIVVYTLEYVQSEISYLFLIFNHYFFKKIFIFDTKL